MIWEILLGVLAAILVLVVFSLLLSGLSNIYRKLYINYLKDKVYGPGLIPVLSVFSAVATIALILAIILLLKFDWLF